jgi:predicted secreted protein
MKDFGHYEHFLGLRTPRSMKSVDLSLADPQVVVGVVLKKGQMWVALSYANKQAHINGWTQRECCRLDANQFDNSSKHLRLNSNTSMALLKRC